MRLPRNHESGLRTGFGPWSGWKLSTVHLSLSHTVALRLQPTAQRLVPSSRGSVPFSLWNHSGNSGTLGSDQAPLLPPRSRSTKRNPRFLPVCWAVLPELVPAPHWVRLCIWGRRPGELGGASLIWIGPSVGARLCRLSQYPEVRTAVTREVETHRL